MTPVGAMNKLVADGEKWDESTMQFLFACIIDIANKLIILKYKKITGLKYNVMSYHK